MHQSPVIPEPLAALVYLRETHLVGRPGRPAQGDKPARPAQPGIVPFSASQLWKLTKQGKFPKPVKLSARVTAWRTADVLAWIAQHDA